MEPLIEIRSELRQYVDAKIDYAQFRAWIADVYAKFAEAGESPELRICRAIEWEMADYSEGMVSEGLLRQSLSSLCNSSEDSRTPVPTFAIVRVSTIGTLSSIVSFAGSGTESPRATGLPTGSFGHTLTEQHAS
jgi:hypothetical protein